MTDPKEPFISATQLIDALAAKGLLSEKAIANLRKQVGATGGTAPAAVLAKRLVELKAITADQAKQVLGELAKAASKPAAAPKKKSLFDEELAPLSQEPSPFSEPEPMAPKSAPGASGSPMDALLAAGALEAAAAGTPLTPLVRKKTSPFATVSKYQKPALIGLGVLVVLGVLAGAAVWFLQPGGDLPLADADNQFRAKAYDRAAGQYADFLKAFPNHSGANAAQARLALCQLQVALGKNPLWPDVLAKVRQAVVDLGAIVSLADERRMVTSCLPTLAEQLVAAAKDKPDDQRIAQAEEAMALIRQCVPKSERNWDQLARLEWTLATAKRAGSRDRELAAATAEITKAATAGDTKAAYAARVALIRFDPKFAASAELAQAMLSVCQAERRAVKKEADPPKPATTEADGPIEAEIAFSEPLVRGTVPGVDGRAVAVRFGGSVYGLDAASGKLLWARYVGCDAPPAVPVDDKPGADLIVVRRAPSDVLCLDAKAGRLQWRFPIGEPVVGKPVAGSDKVVVATTKGRLAILDVKSGQPVAFLRLPQALRVAPAVDWSRGLIFQPADSCNLYVISAANGECKDVFYIGHDLAMLGEPPQIDGRNLLVRIRKGPSSHVVATYATGDGPDLQWRLKQESSKPEIVGRFNRPKQPAFENCDSAECLGSFGGVNWFSGRRNETPGTVVAAADAKNGVPIWTTWVNAALVDSPFAAQNGLLAVSSAGAAFLLDGASKPGFDCIVSIAKEPPLELRRIDAALSLGDDRVLAAGLQNKDAVLVESPNKMRLLGFPDELSARPVAWKAGILAPGKSGQIALIAPKTWTKAAEPFTAPWTRKAKVNWQSPCPIDDSQFVVSDGIGSVYVFEVRKETPPRLAIVTQADAKPAIVSPLVMAGKTVYGVNASGSLAAFRLPKLESEKTWELGGESPWGPYSLGDRALAGSTNGKMIGAGESVWQADRPYGKPAGSPLVEAKDFTIAFENGIVARFEKATGKETAKVDLGRPLATGPALLGGVIWIGDADGTLLKLKKDAP